jgi:hypothetical protein
MEQKPVVDQESRRKRALIVFQILIYGYLLALIIIQFYMYSQRDW